MNQSVNRLAAGDARFVEVKKKTTFRVMSMLTIKVLQVYHSNGGKLGMMPHVVDSDKYISKLKFHSDEARSSTFFR